MSYEDKINESKQKVYEKAIATKILDLMGDLRKSQNDETPRRWIWELIQNAKDVAYDNSKISIKINMKYLENGSAILEFKHNGMPFSISNTTFLIEQVSTKDRDGEEAGNKRTTGKFGTGFLTTHLLSEKVQVEGIVKEDNEPYKKFKLLLDRSGRNLTSIMESVQRSHLQLQKVSKEAEYENFKKKDFNTVFRYKLDENGVNVARKGLEDFRKSVIYMLAFVPEIASICMEHENIIYYLSEEVMCIGDTIKIYTINKSSDWGVEKKFIALLRKNDTVIAAQIDYEEGIPQFKSSIESVPKLFCDFPLVGSEDFVLPIVINNPYFKPNDPRTGVYLTDTDDIDVEENKGYVKEAIELYEQLVKEASKYDWRKMYVIANLSVARGKDWISESWIKNEVLLPIREKLLDIAIIDTENHGKIPIGCNDDVLAEFPEGSSEEIRNDIWNLVFQVIPNKIPRIKENEEWHKVIWNDCGKLTLERLARAIECEENINRLDEKFKEIDAVSWLNQYFIIAGKDHRFKKDFLSGDFKIIPNQNGDFQTYTELREDISIEDSLKDVLKLLNVDIREGLLNKAINIDWIPFKKIEQDDVVEKINKNIREGSFKDVIGACIHLTAIYSNDKDFPEAQEALYGFGQDILHDIMPEKREIINWNQGIWEESNKKMLKHIRDAISDEQNIDNLSRLLRMHDAKEALKWMYHWVNFIIRGKNDYIINTKKHPFLPNQNGTFKCKDELCLDDGSTDDELKDIIEQLGYDYRAELLDKTIFLVLQENTTKKIQDSVTKIVELGSPIIAKLDRTKEEKMTLRKLYLWFVNNKEKAEKYFGDLYKKKHRLYDDEEIAVSMQRAEQLQGIMDKYELSDVSEIEQLLYSKRKEQPMIITQEILLSMGVSSMDELEVAMIDTTLSARFIHTSMPSLEAFAYVQVIIERSKKNVIKYLKTLPTYDCSDMEEISNTVIAGIKKKNLEIHVVVRPADNGEVIIYYSSEKDILDYENAELWVDNGIDTPKHLTLGGILKTTGINRIPISRRWN